MYVFGIEEKVTDEVALPRTLEEISLCVTAIYAALIPYSVAVVPDVKLPDANVSLILLTASVDAYSPITKSTTAPALALSP